MFLCGHTGGQTDIETGFLRSTQRSRPENLNNCTKITDVCITKQKETTDWFRGCYKLSSQETDSAYSTFPTHFPQIPHGAVVL